MKKLTLGLALILCFSMAPIMAQAEPQPAGKASASFEKRIDPELLEAYHQQPGLDFAKNGPDFLRGLLARLVGSTDLPKDAAVKVYDTQIPGQNPGDKVRLRIYQPVDLPKDAPGILWIHGGGFLFGVPEQDEAQSLRWAKEVGAVVVAVDYRLSPYPAPLDDCYAGLVWLAQEAQTLGIDKNRIAVAGSSSGGGLAAALALKARDQGGPHLAFQMPLYPMIDDRFTTPASGEEFGHKVWNNTDNLYAWQVYLGPLMGTDQVTPYMAPARAVDLSGLPPAYFCVGDLDPFRDDTIDYVSRLSQAGVPVEFHLYPGGYHVFEALAPQTEYAQRLFDEYVYVLKKALAR